MSRKQEQPDLEFEQVPIRIHPRVFAALGADLVTSDVVAVIELVKNSYDAFAETCWIRFGTSEGGEFYLEVEDDGQGMSRDTIEDVWAVVATPNKFDNPKARMGRKQRRVVGEKGLGRLSVARLGSRLEMVTQAKDESCWEVFVDWEALADETKLTDCFVGVREYQEDPPFKKTGTRIRIHDLAGSWDEPTIADLEDNLARLISPFNEVADFHVMLSSPDAEEAQSVAVESPEFLSKPKYQIKGEVGEDGAISGAYRFRPFAEGRPREKKLSMSWEQVYDSILEKERAPFSPDEYSCGPFAFEVRAWDMAPDDTEEIATKFNFQKSRIRKAIRSHKGISVYRDDILVLPKSDQARDWLGLDLRRVSKVGERLSTSQVVGYVAISGDENPGIVDTSDRERLVSRLESAEFEEALKAIVGLLEVERLKDRYAHEDKPQPMQELFDQLSAEDLIAEVLSLAEEGADASEAVPLLTAFNKSLDKARKTIQERFIYYSRMATVGTIAQMLVHEIRNRTTSFGEFLEIAKSRFGPFKDEVVKREYLSADEALTALERLADTFSPLASRSFRRRKRSSHLEDRINKCVALNQAEIDRKGVSVSRLGSTTMVAVDPGELDAIVLNLLTNAIFWLGETDKSQRRIEIKLSTISNGERVRVWVHDSGRGVDEDDVEKIFRPGVTRKPGGIGMGLTVASEIVSEYGGRMTAKYPGNLGGASFAFDLPIKH